MEAHRKRTKRKHRKRTQTPLKRTMQRPMVLHSLLGHHTAATSQELCGINEQHMYSV